ncbi:MAG: DUF4965 domain-containing protein [Clostridia bacterium]|nr:DUF4965 domain-containing protein [Clostridia bacterium]
MKRILSAYPLFVKDPYFSFWAQSESLAEDVVLWTGAKKGVYGVLKIDGKPYAFMGKKEGVEALPQTKLSVSAFSTDYEFEKDGVRLALRFVSPLPPDDIELTSCPVCYVAYEVTGAKDVEIVFALHENVCYNADSEGDVRGGTLQLNGFDSTFFGVKKQAPLSRCDDVAGADWGYYYLSGERTFFTSEEGYAAYLTSGDMDALTNAEKNANGGKKYVVSSNKSRKGVVLVGYDDVAAARYYGATLQGYYLEEHTLPQALEYTYSHIDEIENKLHTFEGKLSKAIEKYGEEYRDVLYASLRQSVGAHKIVKNKKGELLFLSKECNSNACTATVDVSYPSAPLYLLYNPELVRGMLRPIFDFARLPVWTYDFAPHDAGVYPLCCGQRYGLKENCGALGGNALDCGDGQTWFDVYALPASAEPFKYESQMPVEECANVLIMLAALYHADNDLSLTQKNEDLLEKWVQYLVKYGLKPENQLCSDDFAGHLKNNLNLAIKAAVGIAAYAELCGALGKTALQNEYRKIAEEYAQTIEKFGAGKSHLPLTWDTGEETFSLKYNLAFDKLLGYGLFSQALLEKETDYYLAQAKEYGVQLDTRANYTKTDWTIWAAYLTDDIKKRKQFIRLVDKFMKNTANRVPFGDWYDTVTAETLLFRNRTVQGGCFILLF